MSYTGNELQEYIDANNLNQLLYEHQKDVIQWMYYRCFNRKGSLLAHSMGLGKTLDICILLQIVLARRALIICPTSCVYSQWIRNLLTYTSYYKVYVLKSNKLRQVMMDNELNIIKSNELPISILNNEPNIPKVVVCNYHAVVPHPAVQKRNGVLGSKYETNEPIDVYNPELTPFNEIVWDIVIVDEVHAIRNGVNTVNDGDVRKKMLRYYRLSRLRMTPNIGVRIGLTGTPIQNRISDIVSIYTFLGVKFTKRFTPDEIKNTNKEYMHRITADDLHPILRSKINFPDTPYVEITKKVIYETQNEEDVYRIVAGLLNGENIPGGELNPYSAVQYHDNPLVRTCRECYLSADINMFVDIHNKAYEDFGIILPRWEGTESKMNMIVNDIFELSLENKSLICFIHYHSEKFAVINKINEISERLGVDSRFGYLYFYIDGSVSPEERDYVLKETKRIQNNGQRCICFATIQSSAEGLNMQHFDTVLFTTSDWNPAMEFQAIARAHRIGQKNVVKVYRYIHEYIMENKIKHIDDKKIGKQNMKIAKSDEFVDESENAAHSWNIRDLDDFPGEKSVIFQYRNNHDEYLSNIQDEGLKAVSVNYNNIKKQTLAKKNKFKTTNISELVNSFYGMSVNNIPNITQPINNTQSSEEIRRSRIQNFGGEMLSNP